MHTQGIIMIGVIVAVLLAIATAYLMRNRGR